jgi:hypothetical protein
VTYIARLSTNLAPMRFLGVALALLGLALAVYSVPFVTWITFGVFLAGLATTVLGVRLAVRGKHAPSN